MAVMPRHQPQVLRATTLSLPGDSPVAGLRTVSKYKPEVSRVMNKQTNEIEYYNSKRVYRYEKW